MRLSRLLIMAALNLAATNVAAQGVIDVHCHNILPSFLEVLESHDALLDEGFPLPKWDVESHLAFMEEAGIETSVLTMPAPQPWFGDVAESKKAVREYNEQCARLKKEYPGKFRFCAALPLPDVDAAIEEAGYALDSLGADGIKLATNVRGQYLGDEALEPLMKVLDERKAVIIIHPHKPSPVNEGMMAQVPLAIYEYPAETTRTIVNLLAHNTLARYPNVKMVVPHCGSFLPLAIPRMKAVLPAIIAKNLMEPVDFEANLSRLYYDLAGAASPEAIRTMLTITTPDHIMYGSDYPYQPAERLAANLKRLERELAADSELAQYQELILHTNAENLFSHE